MAGPELGAELGEYVVHLRPSRRARKHVPRVLFQTLRPPPRVVGRVVGRVREEGPARYEFAFTPFGGQKTHRRVSRRHVFVPPLVPQDAPRFAQHLSPLRSRGHDDLVQTRLEVDQARASVVSVEIHLLAVAVLVFGLRARLVAPVLIRVPRRRVPRAEQNAPAVHR